MAGLGCTKHWSLLTLLTSSSSPCRGTSHCVIDTALAGTIKKTADNGDLFFPLSPLFSPPASIIRKPTKYQLKRVRIRKKTHTIIIPHLYPFVSIDFGSSQKILIADGAPNSAIWTRTGSRGSF